MSKFVEWSNELSVGIEEIDFQHKVLIDLLNEIHEAIQQRQDTEVTRNIVRRLDEYTRVHFAVEESLMRILHYPEYERAQGSARQADRTLEWISRQAGCGKRFAQLRTGSFPQGLVDQAHHGSGQALCIAFSGARDPAGIAAKLLDAAVMAFAGQEFLSERASVGRAATKTKNRLRQNATGFWKREAVRPPLFHRRGIKRTRGSPGPLPGCRPAPPAPWRLWRPDRRAARSPSSWPRSRPVPRRP